MFMKLNWTQVGLLYSSTYNDSLYVRAAESFLSYIRLIDISLNVVLIDIKQDVSINSTLVRIQQSGLLAFLVLLPHQTSGGLICAAQRQSLEYAWVLVDNGVSSINTYRGTNQGSSESAERLIDNIFLIRQSPCTNNFISPQLQVLNDKGTGSDWLATDSENPHSIVLKNSVWALSYALNASLDTLERSNLSLENYGIGMSHITEVVEEKLSNVTLPGRTNSISIDRYPSEECRVMEILQLQSGNFQQVGYFDTHTKSLFLNLTVSIHGLGLTNTYSYDTFPNTLTILSVGTGFCFLFTTLVLIIFIAYRIEPEVKATSAWLSLCMFSGCYLILLGALTHFLANGFPLKTEGERISTCIIDTFCISIGVDLIFTTLLAKLLRIWRIFTLHGRTGKAWTDISLLLFISLVVLVKFAMLLIWTISDVYRLEDHVTLVSTDHNNYHYQIIQQCASKHYSVWLVLIYGYSAIIGLAIIAVAIITRKIKQDNFKDTKKISILISTILFMATVCASLWAIMRLSDDSITSKVIIGLAYCLIPMLCEVFLFLPKVVPPLMRQFKTAVVHKPKSDSTGPTISTQTSTILSVN